MSADFLKDLPEWQQRIARRSVALARRHGIGPFALRKAFDDSHVPPAYEPYYPNLPAVGASYDPPYIPDLWPSSGPVSELVECPLAQPTKIGLDHVVSVYDRLEPCFHFDVGHLNLYLSPDKDGDNIFLIRNGEKTFWQENMTSRMNRRAALYAIETTTQLLTNEVLAQEIQRYDYLPPNMRRTLSQVRARCDQTLNTLTQQLPPDQPIKAYKHPTNEERAWFKYNDIYGGHNFIPEKPYADSSVDLCHFPLFPDSGKGDIKAFYGAFRFQRYGIIHWVQFANLDGSPTQDFIEVSPHDRTGEHPKSTMSQEQALNTLKIIDAELAADHPLRRKGVLKRLEEAAKELPSDPYYHKMITVKNMGLMALMSTGRGLVP